MFLIRLFFFLSLFQQSHRNTHLIIFKRIPIRAPRETERENPHNSPQQSVFSLPQKNHALSSFSFCRLFIRARERDTKHAWVFGRVLFFSPSQQDHVHMKRLFPSALFFLSESLRETIHPYTCPPSIFFPFLSQQSHGKTLLFGFKGFPSET